MNPTSLEAQSGMLEESLIHLVGFDMRPEQHVQFVAGLQHLVAIALDDCSVENGSWRRKLAKLLSYELCLHALSSLEGFSRWPLAGLIHNCFVKESGRCRISHLTQPKSPTATANSH